MSNLSYVGLLAVVLISFLVPLLIGFFPFIRVPAPVLLIVFGIAVGPSGLGWVKIDIPVKVLSLIGLAFLLFLAGLEIDPRRLRGPIVRQTGLGYLFSLALAAVVGFGLGAGGVTKSPLLIAIALSATSLGLVVPVLKDAGQSESQVGQFTIAGASVADFGAVLLLSVFFSMSRGSTTGKFILLGGFVVLIVVAVATLLRLGTSERLNSVLVMLQDTTAEIRVRFAVVLLVLFVVLASKFGLETILGAFLAGAILNFVDRDSMSHPKFPRETRRHRLRVLSSRVLRGEWADIRSAGASSLTVGIRSDSALSLWTARCTGGSCRRVPIERGTSQRHRYRATAGHLASLPRRCPRDWRQSLARSNQ